MKKLVYIRTFGCQMNVHDSEKMLGVMEKKGYSLTGDIGKADVIIFNTCSIRQKAEQKFYSELGRIKSYKKRRPDLKIAVAGCIAQHEGKKIMKHAPHVDMVFGPQNIRVLNHIGSPLIPSVATEDNPNIAQEDLPAIRQDGVKAWVTIMYGCDNFCSYCIVPHTRGREKSRPVEHILDEVSHLAGKGYREITLLGQNVNSYSSDTDFPGLLRKLDTISGIERIRFVTSHPRDLSDKLIATMEELQSLCEHIHLPLQSGSNRVLQLMNRGYSYDAYTNKINKLRRRIPEIAITTDIIAGFPGETDEDHTFTLRALREIEFDGIFAFKFSKRPGTKAAEMKEQVPDGIKSQRLEEILEVQDAITSRKNKSLEGTVHEILVEGCNDMDIKQYIGRTRTNKIVTISDSTLRAGLLFRVEIIRGRRHSLEGNVLLP